MNSVGSTYFLVACIIVGAMSLVGLGVLFARSENIERPNLVGATTLVFCAVAVFLLWDGSRTGINIGPGVGWSAIGLSLFGFALGRVWDLILGGRDKVHHDDATLGADLAD